MKIAFVFAISFLLMFSSGCTGKKPPEPGVVDYMTGGEQLKTYQKTKSKLEEINKTLEERNQDIN